MAVSGPFADRRGIQKPYAQGYARGWNQFSDSGGGTAVSPVEKFSHKGLANLHQIEAEFGSKYEDVCRSCPLKGRSN